MTQVHAHVQMLQVASIKSTCTINALRAKSEQTAGHDKSAAGHDRSTVQEQECAARKWVYKSKIQG